MASIMSLLNYLIILPAYSWVMGIDDWVTSTAKMATVMGAILPFNFIKGVIVSILFIPMFIKLQQWIEQKRMQSISS